MGFSASRIHWNIGAFLLIAFIGSLLFAWFRGVASAGDASVFATLIAWIPFILTGFMLNLLMSVFAMVLATAFGIGLGLMQISQYWAIRTPGKLITQVFRNSPWLVILFVVMYLVPFEFRTQWFGAISIPDWVKATIAFSLPVMANISEILRGAVRSIPSGQWESAESLAFTRGQTLRHVILPQCVKRAIPPWMNWYALLALSTPIASILGVHEAVGNAQAAMEAAGGRPEFLAPFYLFLLCLFFAYIYPIAVLTRRLERKYAIA